MSYLLRSVAKHKRTNKQQLPALLFVYVMIYIQTKRKRCRLLYLFSFLH